MDKCELKQFQISRGFTYCYYRYSDPNRTKPTLLFLHGFPSTKEDWVHQIEHFVPKGFSIIAVDTLGYGGTSKPTEVIAYRVTDMAKDITEILDFENERKVIVIAHDWGSGISARMIDNHRDYLIAAVFLNVGYIPQPSGFNWEQAMKYTDLSFGYSTFGYWEFFGNVRDAHIITEKNIDSFYSLGFPNDPELWRTDLCPRGKAQEWIEGNKQAPRAAYWDEETMRAHQRRLLSSGGLEAPFLYYRVYFTGVNNRPNPPSPEEMTFSTPTLLIPCSKDYVALKELQIQRTRSFAQNLIVEEFDCGHWIMFEKPELLNERLAHFLDNLKLVE
ncbi:hypothetical protein Clacol_000748 [Clathrus columnatus]|uniref:AB hydrolase-1 domain-containing protein n=1 Tax=Clathrus columnatus TaxID=1419009 RepID=A0AAV4ZX23_9AGAM|nr:hypothetical protein Clacol_000748 [Clathrus columnatus]